MKGQVDKCHEKISIFEPASYFLIAFICLSFSVFTTESGSPHQVVAWFINKFKSIIQDRIFKTIVKLREREGQKRVDLGRSLKGHL